jgi:hypothetical protein
VKEEAERAEKACRVQEIVEHRERAWQTMEESVQLV